MKERAAKIQLLRTKLHRPQVPDDHVHRPRLIEKLDRGRDLPLTLVSAPAGYGKSTLVSSWLQACDRPSAWLSLDEDDNDLRLFLAYFLSAAESVSPNAFPKTNELLGAAALPPLHVLVGSLVNELDQVEQFRVLGHHHFSLGGPAAQGEFFQRQK